MIWSIMHDHYEAAGSIGTLYEIVDQAAQEKIQHPEFKRPKPDVEPGEDEDVEDDMSAMPDIPGLSVRPLAPKSGV